ncbi:MAG: DUF5702 domain-containing protein [Lachnospiraceae bacterium]|nr:DUF5702 domain-containing protein [Lachnospiraceae bacterium]
MLILMTSFVFTTLEGARITGSKAQLTMLSEMAADSFASNYYYPLFEEYGLLAVDGGFGGKEADKDRIKKEILGYLSPFYENSEGGLLLGNSPGIKIDTTGTLLNSEKAGLRQQIRDEAVYEGAELLLEGILGNEMFESADVLQEVYDKQAETMEAAAAVTSEILKLMTLIDGVLTTDTGLELSDDGKILMNIGFLKILGLKDESYMKGTYGNLQIFSAAKGKIIYLDDVIERELVSLNELEQLDSELSEKRNELTELGMKKQDTDAEIEGLIEEKEILLLNTETEKDEARTEAITEKMTELRNFSDNLSEDMRVLRVVITDLEKARSDKASACRSVYELIGRIIGTGLYNSRESIKELAAVKIKQEAARLAADEYEAFLKETEGLPGEILKSLLDDTANLKAYMTLEKSGYDTDKMLQTLSKNVVLLYTAELPAFESEAPAKMMRNLQKSRSCIGEMTYACLKFNYGGLKATSETGENVKATLAQAVSGGLLKYLGVEEVSKKKLNGLELPSKGDWENDSDDVFTAFDKMSEFFKEADPGETLKKAGETLASDFVTEVWLANHFSNFAAQRSDTMLAYEREYVLAGKQTDVENLASAALKLTAMRAVFTFASLMADASRNSEAMALAASISGFTGIPALLYVVKYAILVTWALEEALVEVSGLFMGKKIPIYSPAGRVSIGEILVMTGAKVKEKAAAIPENLPGVSYMQYITILSFFEDLDKKELRIADVIQENIRLKYRDPFRMKNAITDVSFTSSVKTKTKFDTGFFTDDVYMISTQTDMSY